MATTSSQPDQTAVSSQIELRAQLNLTRVTKKKETPYLKACPEAYLNVKKKGEVPRTAARCFNTHYEQISEKLEKRPHLITLYLNNY